jgi:hypothetical protein
MGRMDLSGPGSASFIRENTKRINLTTLDEVNLCPLLD